MDNNSANPYLSPEETNANRNKQLCHSHLFGSVVFLLSWTPSMMEKELAGSNSLLLSSYRQWAAVSANLLPIWGESRHKLDNSKLDSTQQ